MCRVQGMCESPALYQHVKYQSFEGPHDMQQRQDCLAVLRYDTGGVAYLLGIGHRCRRFHIHGVHEFAQPFDDIVQLFFADRVLNLLHHPAEACVGINLRYMCMPVGGLGGHGGVLAHHLHTYTLDSMC